MMHAPPMLIVAYIVVVSASSSTIPQAKNDPFALFQRRADATAGAQHPTKINSSDWASNQLLEDDQDQREPRPEIMEWMGIVTHSRATPPRSKTCDFWNMDKARKKLSNHQSEPLLVSVKNNRPPITTDAGNRSMLSAAFSSDKMLLRQQNNSIGAMLAALLTTVPWIALSVGLLSMYPRMYLYVTYIGTSWRGKLNSSISTMLDRHHRRMLNSACVKPSNLSSPFFWRALVLLLLPWLTNAAGCSNTNASQINVASCTCGTTDCTAATGLYCEIKRNKCFWPAFGAPRPPIGVQNG